MRGNPGIRWKNSIQTRQIIGFSLIILFMIISSAVLQWNAMELASRTTYEKMTANAEFFLDTFENELTHVQQLQMEFFNDRKLPFLESPQVEISEYERREYLLSVRERLQTVTGVSDLVKDAILCLPEAGYWITPGGIRRMNGENREQLDYYLSFDTGEVCFDGTDFFIVQTGSSRSMESGLPRNILILLFSTDEIREDMAGLNTSEDTGSFFYFDREDFLLSSGGKEAMERKMYDSLKKNESGEYLDIQRVKIDGEWYLICVGGQGALGLFVQYSRELPIMSAIYSFRRAMFLIIGVMIVMAVSFIIYMRRAIHRPIRILLKAFSDLESGDWSVNIRHEGQDEFGQLYDGFNRMKERIVKLIDEVYVQTSLAQRAQLKQLQAQINPHFLYNSFFILSRRIKRGDYDNAIEIAEHLGDYFRFLTRNESDYIPLRKEVEHAQSYAAIQAARFVGRIRVEFEELPEEAAGILVPRLILQPLLENAFGHGLYNKAEDGLLRVSFTQNEESLFIDVEDNGEELSDGELERLKKMLDGEDNGEITGMINIHKRLQYYFHKKGGLKISRSSLGGLKITVVVDKGEAEDGTESADRG